MIKVVDVHKGFGDEPVLKGINTEFEKGKTNVIIGQSGSGKTVLLKCLLGLLTPEKENTFYNKKCLLEWDKEKNENLREKTVSQFKEGELFNRLNIKKNIRFQL